MKKIITFLTCLISLNLVAQNLTVKSTKELNFNAKDLYLYRFLGEDERNFYTLFSSDSSANLLGNLDKMKLVAFDKNSMEEVASLPVMGFEGLDVSQTYHTCLLKDGKVWLFKSKKTETSEQLLLEILDTKLTTLTSQKLVYENTHTYDLKRASFKKHASSIVVLFNQKSNGPIVIGGEIPVMDEHVKLEYGFLDNDLELSSLNYVKLPVVLADKSYGLSSTYECLDNGDLLLRGVFTADKEEGAKSNVVDGGILLADVNPYHTISYIKVASNEILTIELPMKKATIKQTELRNVLTENECRVYGLYENSEKGKDDEQGLYCAKISLPELSSTIEYIPFEKRVIDSLNTIPAIGNYYSIHDLVLSDNRISVILVPVVMGIQYNHLYRSGGIWSKIVTFDMENNLQWIATARTNPTPRAYRIADGSKEMMLFYSRKKNKTAGKVTLSGPAVSGGGFYSDDFYGYSTIDMESGRIVNTKEIEFLESKPYMWVSTFKNDTFFGIDCDPIGKKYSGHLIRITLEE